MFTGIVVAVGKLLNVDAGDKNRELLVDPGVMNMDAVRVGDSIAVNGVCLTVTGLQGEGFSADVSQETLDRTTLGNLERGAAVNLEPALTLNQPLGGHIVNGHVDGVAKVRSVAEDGTCRRLKIEVPSDLARYIAEKGSVCVDGVSLTVNAVEGPRFQVMIVPHSLQNTIIGNYSAGSPVNIEVDMIARYLERILQYTDLSGKAERTD